jgi:hypothetical protein
MRIAQVLADGQWKSSLEIMHRFCEEGWTFINVAQISTLCRITDGIEQRKIGAYLTNRLNNPEAFYDYMARDGRGQGFGVRHRNHEIQMTKILSPTRSLGPSNE